MNTMQNQVSAHIWNAYSSGASVIECGVIDDGCRHLHLSVARWQNICADCRLISACAICEMKSYCAARDRCRTRCGMRSLRKFSLLEV